MGEIVFECKNFDCIHSYRDGHCKKYGNWCTGGICKYDKECECCKSSNEKSKLVCEYCKSF